MYDAQRIVLAGNGKESLIRGRRGQDWHVGAANTATEAVFGVLKHGIRIGWPLEVRYLGNVE